MSEIKRRRRTGCLTCRTRRVKCDERKPTCERCEAANMECAGYAPKTRIVVREVPTKRKASSASSQPRSSVEDEGGNDHHAAASVVVAAEQNFLSPPASASAQSIDLTYYPQPKFRDDGLPLVALPSNPPPPCRPCTASREVLAYHQYLFRTLPVLFPLEHLPFWRDRLCEQAWGIEYLYLTISALGSMHRSTLMMSMLGENDRNRGLDTKVIAVQSYTKALQELSGRIDEAEKTPDILAAVLLLMAYFEVFSSNIPAAYSHVQTAHHYFMSIDPSILSAQGNTDLDSLGTALRNLGWTCYMALPLPGMFVSASIHAPSTNSSVATLSMQKSLLHLVTESGLQDLIWGPLPIILHNVSSPLPDKLHLLKKRLREWKDKNSTSLPHLESDTAQQENAIRESQFSIPPPSYLAASPQICVAGATYSFLMARTLWALTFLESGLEMENCERLSYLHFYETMRFAATQAATSSVTLASNAPGRDDYVSCEALDNSLLPILYITGQCSARPSWLHWIAQLMSQIGGQGLFNGSVFAASLRILHTLESHHSRASTDALEIYPSPTHRIISVLVPETSADGFLCYYGKPCNANRDPALGSSALTYYPFAHARLSAEPHDDDAMQREAEIYEDERSKEASFTMDWLLNRPVPQEWRHRSMQVKFDLDRVFRDHVNGSRLLPPTRRGRSEY
ncbi:hypothetical protein PT974_04660 [Cladobotryum mycophilum]|uniref:Zn(2)-C6 fungal-type domain-containing protein n=1 Tax=Cladobotryum mycophilum TaxID=491253 RepID=A0ABR0SW38_9HYPO